MLTMTLTEYNAIHKDYRSVWTTERWQDDNWEEKRLKYLGKRTMMKWIKGYGTSLLVEGIHFTITE